MPVTIATQQACSYRADSPNKIKNAIWNLRHVSSKGRTTALAAEGAGRAQPNLLPSCELTERLAVMRARKHRNHQVQPSDFRCHRCGFSIAQTAWALIKPGLRMQLCPIATFADRDRPLDRTVHDKHDKAWAKPGKQIYNPTAR
jgi:hypothetical protein